MPVTTERSEEIIAAWRSGAADIDGWENPAGPLLSRYAESELTTAFIETRRASACTGSFTHQCC
ncbi:hypothetical protein Skr01_62280 [Sphaerisporangium krabiense]|uniref:Uncharacterized protein n=1 Tax=Sphaerisporangium krabiense TaxID=763782 RepID=A0A7W8Z2S5_9ACTN|nr:DUF6229 family protein [Sphaerisporangium krabiense]MBB5626190.1 hypothetical protein [Sphaerisporangium krabiense]GII66143.1 hypothetical protein Skr01_62280 [Sphaerisporangium krabiense]